MPNKSPPVILSVTTIAKTRMFTVEQIELEFTNFQTRKFERLRSGQRRSVMIAAVDENNRILLVQEYAAGTERYELGLPKGLIENNETIFDGANRELQEEAGFKARHIQEIIDVTLAPNYMSHSSHLVLATGLSASKLEGDEPEPLGLIYHDLENINELIFSGQVTEARSIAGLYIVQNYLKERR